MDRFAIMGRHIDGFKKCVAVGVLRNGQQRIVYHLPNLITTLLDRFAREVDCPGHLQLVVKNLRASEKS